MIKKNAVQKAKEIRVPARFSISYDQVAEVVNHYESGFECGLMFFRLGYMQVFLKIVACLVSNFLNQ